MNREFLSKIKFKPQINLKAGPWLQILRKDNSFLYLRLRPRQAVFLVTIREYSTLFWGLRYCSQATTSLYPSGLRSHLWVAIETQCFPTQISSPSASQGYCAISLAFYYQLGVLSCWASSNLLSSKSAMHLEVYYISYIISKFLL